MRIDYYGSYTYAFAAEIAQPKRKNSRGFSFDGSSDDKGSWMEFPGNVLNKGNFDTEGFAKLYLNSKTIHFRNLIIKKDTFEYDEKITGLIPSDVEEITLENVTADEGAFMRLELAKLRRVTINNTPYTVIENGERREYKTDISEADRQYLTTKAINKEETKKDDTRDLVEGGKCITEEGVASYCGSTSKANTLQVGKVGVLSVKW